MSKGKCPTCGRGYAQPKVATTVAVELHNQGLSLRKIAAKLSAEAGQPISHLAVQRALQRATA